MNNKILLLVLILGIFLVSSCMKEPIPQLGDLLLEVGETAEKSASDAVSICKSLSMTMYKEYCFEKIALTLNQSSYCDSIEDETRRDSCLMNYALQTSDFSICEQVNQLYLRENCFTLKDKNDSIGK